MKKWLDSLWQEITKVLRFVLKNPSLLKMVLRLGYLICKLLEYHDEK